MWGICPMLGNTGLKQCFCLLVNLLISVYYSKHIIFEHIIFKASFSFVNWKSLKEAWGEGKYSGETYASVENKA